MPLEWNSRLIDLDVDLDIAPFDLSEAEIRSIDRTIYSGHQNAWPPPPPDTGKGVLPAVSMNEMCCPRLSVSI
jgi:hypothetical protein